MEEFLHKKNKIEIGRGNVTEWYINEESGLEQGFTIYPNFTPTKPKGIVNKEFPIF